MNVLPEMVIERSTTPETVAQNKGNTMIPQMNVIVNEVEVHLVSIEGKVFANSLDVASVFEKQHKHVMQKVENFGERAKANFRPSEYTDATGRKLPMLEMNRDGFMFLAMGFTGEKAENWKLDLIDAFNNMEEMIRQPKILTVQEQIVLISRGNQEIDSRVTLLEQTKRLEAWQEKALQDAKNQKVYSFGVKDPGQISKLHRAVWRYVKRTYSLPRYNELPAIKFDEAVKAINNLTLMDLVA
jgi:Rha family phage regulatory protein